MLNVVSKPKPQKEPAVGHRKYKKSTPRQKLEKQLDALCREIVVDRDLYCVCPSPIEGHKGAMQAGHLVTRYKESIRWDLYNLSCQCAGCNMRHENYPHYYTEWFLEKFGLENYSRLCRDGERVEKLQLYELQELFDQLRKIRQRQLVSILQGEPFKPYFTQKEILSGAWSEK